MAIGMLNAASATHLYKVNSKQTKKTEESKSAFSPREERVEIHSDAKEQNEIKKAVDATPDVRIELVAELQAKIKSNDYPIEGNIDELVRKMIQQNVFGSAA